MEIVSDIISKYFENKIICLFLRIRIPKKLELNIRIDLRSLIKYCPRKNVYFVVDPMQSFFVFYMICISVRVIKSQIS